MAGMSQSTESAPLQHRAGEKIRAFRADHGLSAEELGKRINPPCTIPAQTIYNWEKRGKVARPWLQRKLNELGICAPGDWLVTIEEAA